MKFKLGDKVKIIGGNMLEKAAHIGEICKIENIDISYGANSYLLEGISLYFSTFELELVDELKESDIVYVSDTSEEDALENEEQRIYLLTYPKGKIRKYCCVIESDSEDYVEGRNYTTINYGYAIKKPIEEKKERKIIVTDSEGDNIKNILNIK